MIWSRTVVAVEQATHDIRRLRIKPAKPLAFSPGQYATLQFTPEQQKKMLVEFQTLMVNTYSGALTQVKDQAVVVKPLRAAADQTELVVRSEVRGKGDPIQLDYRLEKAGDGWKIYDVNVGGFWLVDAYKGQFAKDLSAGGLDALIAKLAEKNKSLASAKN